ncbi:MAG: hypothetical protein GXP35_12015 [Actinobacteria bacterium]|nr:hypothetical protein [Actinomycetota bacterium]
MAIHHLTERLEVEAALEHLDLNPPPSDPSLGSGATIRLRELMARFADGPTHLLRRAAIVEVLGAIDLNKVDSLARHLTRSQIADGEAELEQIASTVPVGVVAGLLGVRNRGSTVGRSGSLTDDVVLVAGAIGAGVQVGHAVDAASSRVVAACGGWAVGVAKASLLYQTHGATRALIMTIVDCQPGSQRAPAVLATERIAVNQLSLCGREIDSGDRAVIEIGAVGLEFGHGPHHCPGRGLAEVIANAVAQEFADARYGSTHD